MGNHPPQMEEEEKYTPEVQKIIEEMKKEISELKKDNANQASTIKELSEKVSKYEEEKMNQQ